MSRASRVESFSLLHGHHRLSATDLLSRAATSPCHFRCACTWRHCTCTGIEEIAWPLNDTESIWRWRHKRAPCRCRGIKQRRRHIKVQIQPQNQATMHGRCLQVSLLRPRTADCSAEARTGRSQGVFSSFELLQFSRMLVILCCQYM